MTPCFGFNIIIMDQVDFSIPLGQEDDLETLYALEDQLYWDEEPVDN